jgi:hypothetical protein
MCTTGVNDTVPVIQQNIFEITPYFMNTFRTREKLVALSQVQTGQGIPLVLKDVSLPPPYTDSLPDYQVFPKKYTYKDKN